jgi:hypothetical protein
MTDQLSWSTVGEWLAGFVPEGPLRTAVLLGYGLCVAVAPFIYRYYLGVLAQGAAPEGSIERQDYDKLRASLAGGNLAARLYANRRSKDIGVVPVVIAELKFCDVQSHIFFADLVKCANNTALEDRTEAFDGLRMNCANDLFAASVFDDMMRIDLPDMPIAGPFVGHKQADFFGHRLANESGEHIGANCFDYACYDITLALDSTNNRLLAGTDATATSAARRPCLL